MGVVGVMRTGSVHSIFWRESCIIVVIWRKQFHGYWVGTKDGTAMRFVGRPWLPWHAPFWRIQ